MTLREKLKASLRKWKADVFLRADFAKVGGSEAQVSRALRELVDEGLIVKLGVGVYARAKCSAMPGKPIPVRPVEVLAPEALRNLGVKTYPSRLVAAYNDGETTQLPAGVVVNTGNRRIDRRIGFGNRTVRFENNFKKNVPDRRALGILLMLL
jgi:DNA-binding Lrp family transcriptional regulator